MKYLTLILATVTLMPVIFSCRMNTVKDRETIIRTEHEFAEMAGEKGIPDAFTIMLLTVLLSSGAENS